MPNYSGKHPGGRPTKYNEDVLAHANAYFKRYMDFKVKIPHIEELALELDVDDERIGEWATKTNEKGELVNPQFHATYKKIRTLQKLRLLGETIKPYPAGAIFQLKANHNMIEAEKRIHVGDTQADPIQIIITEAKH